MSQSVELRRAQIVTALSDHCKNGDSYLTKKELYTLCLSNDPALEEAVFLSDLEALCRSGFLHAEGECISSMLVWRSENTVADCLSRLLRLPPPPPITVPDQITLENGVTLTDEQRNAVALALSNRICLILGGAGTGKTTVLRAILHLANYPEWYQAMSCAPTGKAVRNLIDHGIMPARTLHSALGIKAVDEDGCGNITWEQIKLINIDEVSMMTTELLASFLSMMDDNCRLILIGDEQQLPPIGAGNVIADLCALGFPCIRLRENHRLDSDAHCLTENVLHFDEMVHRTDLKTGDSFDVVPAYDFAIVNRIANDAARRIKEKQEVQVVCPYNNLVNAVNFKIRDMVNPKSPYKYEIHFKDKVLRDGDRVIITQNDRDRGCYNGDIGILHIHRIEKEKLSYSIVLSKTRTVLWHGDAAVEQLKHLLLAYAISVHRAQGSEFDYVMMPVAMWMKKMLTRNLFYTAISRARKQVLLYGNPNAIDMALSNELPPRRSMIVPKVKRLMKKIS